MYMFFCHVSVCKFCCLSWVGVCLCVSSSVALLRVLLVSARLLLSSRWNQLPLPFCATLTRVLTPSWMLACWYKWTSLSILAHHLVVTFTKQSSSQMTLFSILLLNLLLSKLKIEMIKWDEILIWYLFNYLFLISITFQELLQPFVWSSLRPSSRCWGGSTTIRSGEFELTLSLSQSTITEVQHTIKLN